jgi:2'-5' RNA ligase
VTDEKARPMRLFIGVRVSLATVRALEDAVVALRERGGAAGLRWLQPATYHITLKFLGWTRPEAVAALGDRVGAALASARELEFETRGLGAFPSAERARVVWAGVDPGGAARLRDLAERTERAAAELGFAREKRAFHPHVTLARLKVPGDVRSLLTGPEQAYRSSWVDSVVLYESLTKSEGSEYRPRFSWSLGADSKGRPRHTRAVEPADEELAEDVGEYDQENDDGEQS